MKHILSIALLTGVIVVGCGKEEEELPVAAPAPGGLNVAAADPLANPAEAGTTTAQSEAFDPNKFGPAPPPMADFSAADRPLGNSGESMDDLQYLNYVLFNYNEGRGTYSPEQVPQFKNEAEQQAYDEAMRKLREPITDLNELVRARVIKAIPTAPAGKKYVVNAKTLKVELVDATAAP